MFSFKIKDDGDCTVIKKHFLLLFFSILKFIFFLLLIWLIYIIYTLFADKLVGDLNYIKYMLFSFMFFILNYCFLKLVLDIIEYNNNLIIIQKDHIVILKASLIMQDDIEVIDSYRVMKVDAFCRGIIPNLLGYGNLVIEQQKDDVRVFHFIPEPFEILKILRIQKELVLNERKKKYIVSDKNNNIELY